MALWRSNGYANTTVADICRAAGVSKGLFFFYFRRKEDLLYEARVVSTEDAFRTMHRLMRQPYEVDDVLRAVLQTVERAMRRNPPDLIVEAVLEGYRQEHRALVEGQPMQRFSGLFVELFERARSDGKLPGTVDVDNLARLAQSLVGEGARHWAAGAFGENAFADVVAADISALVAGYTAAASR